MTIISATRYDLKGDFMSQVGLAYVRGCEIEGMLDGGGRVIEEGPGPRPHVPGDTRTFRIVLDANQYKIDLDGISKGQEVSSNSLKPLWILFSSFVKYFCRVFEKDVYETLNVFLRRKPKENNFKAVLETIRDLMNINCVVPDWLHDIILGYGDPSSAHYSKYVANLLQIKNYQINAMIKFLITFYSLSNEISVLDFNDTFLDIKHIEESFTNYKVVLKENIPASQNIERPFR